MRELSPHSTDSDLLLRYCGEGDEAAFAELLRRHAPLTWGVCLRTLSHRQDAEDAFQVTFLILARDAKRIRHPQQLPSWLYGVAYRTSLRIRRKRDRFPVELPDDLPPPSSGNSDDPFDRLAREDMWRETDAELVCLPEHLRQPLLMRYLHGWSNETIAERLRVSVSAVEGRLKRAKARLRIRLMRRGIELSAGLAVVSAFHRSAQANLAQFPIAETMRLVEQQASLQSVPKNSHLSRILQLVQQENAMRVTQQMIQWTCLSSLAIGLVSMSPLIRFSLAEYGRVSSDTSSIAVHNRLEEASPLSTAEVRMASATSVTANSSSPSAPPDQDEFSAGGVTGTPDGGPPGAMAADAPVPGAGGPLDGSPRSTTSPVSPSSFVHRTQAEAEVLQALADTTKIQFAEESLNDTVATLSQLHGIQILIDYRSLVDESMDPNAIKITLSIHNVSLRSALRHMLKEVGLTYTLANEVLLITTPSQADEIQATHVYALPEKFPIRSSQLIELVRQHVVPDSWTDTGGNGAIAEVPNGFVVTNTFEAHERIETLLAQFSRMPMPSR